MKKIFFLFIIIFYWLPNIIAQGNNEISWFVFDNGFAVQNNSSTISFSLIGQPAVGTSANNNHNIIMGFLSEFATRGSITSLDDQRDNLIPLVYDLYQNYPNPFNPTTKIKYSIPAIEGTTVTLKIFDILGNEIETLVNEEKQAGIYEVTWNAKNVSSGVYFYRIKAGNYIMTKKMILVR